MIVFRHIFDIRHFSYSFPNLSWHISDRVLNLTDFWHISDTFQTVFWQFFVTDRFMTLFIHISDRFLKIRGPTLNKSTEISVELTLLQCIIWACSTGCPKVRVNTFTPLNFFILEQITKPFESCHHEWVRIFLVYKTQWFINLAPA